MHNIQKEGVVVCVIFGHDIYGWLQGFILLGDVFGDLFFLI